MEYLIRFIQVHETFRQPETNALAELYSLPLEWISYSDETPFAIVRFKQDSDHEAAASLLASRSILIHAIYELWGEGVDYDALHGDIKQRSNHLWEQYRNPSFRFELDCFQGSRTSAEQREIMESLAYMDFRGPIVMNKPEHQFMIFEEFKLKAPKPHRVLFGKRVAESGRKVVAKYNLKKRKYIATTSMDAELSLITANLVHAGPGKLAYDPFMGTGSFPLACAHFGSTVFGSDMDGRSIRGKKGRSVRANFEQYATSRFYLDGFTADLTNTPLRVQRCIDSIVCDPPYGVREGLKVLGSNKEALQHEVILATGIPAHLSEGYVPPRKPYSFLRMIDDILDFSGSMLVDNGRLCMWMPVAGIPNDDEAEVAGADVTDGSPFPEPQEDEAEYAIPRHPTLELVSVARQDFTKWSRRLLTYKRISDGAIDADVLAAYRVQRLALQTDGSSGHGERGGKSSADDLNAFRRQYFAGFKTRAEVETYRHQ